MACSNRPSVSTRSLCGHPRGHAPQGHGGARSWRYQPLMRNVDPKTGSVAIRLLRLRLTTRSIIWLTSLGPHRISTHLGLELRNPLGSKSARVAAARSGDLAETGQRRLFACELRCGGHAAAARISVGVAVQGLGHFDGGGCSICLRVGLTMKSSRSPCRRRCASSGSQMHRPLRIGDRLIRQRPYPPSRSSSRLLVAFHA
jgi:hypothetical protein